MDVIIVYLIYQYSLAYNINPRITETIVMVESRGNPTVENKSGAVGLMGVMHGGVIPGRPTREELLDPHRNLNEGLNIFMQGNDAFDNDLEKAIMAYGVGITGVLGGRGEKYLEQFKKEWKKLYPRRVYPWQKLRGEIE